MRFTTSEAAAYYLAAMIDGEGHIAFRRYHNGHQRHVSIVNTDRDLIAACEEACEVLGLPSVTYHRQRKGDVATLHRKDQWDVRITGRDGLERAAAVLPLQASCKRDRLAEVVASYPPRPRSVDAVALYESGVSIREVAQRLGVPASNVQYWVAAKGVQRRPGRPRKG